MNAATHEEHSSAIENAVAWIMMAEMSHPQIRPPVPEYPNPYPMVEAMDGSKPRTEKDTLKLSNREKSLACCQSMT